MSEPGEEGEAAAQPTQPVFRSELAGASRPLVSPDSFSGLSNWAEWIDHFEAAALVMDGIAKRSGCGCQCG